MGQEMGYQTMETPQSRAGHCFLGPGGEKYANKGKVVFNAKDEASRACVTQFNVAEGVEQALGSVAEMLDADQLVLFDNEGSHIISGKSPEAASIRKAASKCKRSTSIHRRKNSFFLPLWIQPEKKENMPMDRPPFQGQRR